MTSTPSKTLRSFDAPTINVVTVTLNPALDLTGHLDVLQLGTVNLINNNHLHPAGKGVNVAKVLADLGANVTVTGFLGADNSSSFCQLFERCSIHDEFIRVAGSTRTNVKLVEQSGRVSDINFSGFHVDAQAIEALEQRLFSLAQDHDYFVIAGSLPNGVSPEHCAQWIHYLQNHSKRVIFDSSGEALATGLAAKPWFIKPNDDELMQLMGLPSNQASQLQQSAAQLAQQGIENIAVSMGKNGVMWLQNGVWLQAIPPAMPIVSTVGAGDTLVAGLCWGQMQQMPRNELLRFATALSALAVGQIGVGLTDKQALNTLLSKIQLIG